MHNVPAALADFNAFLRDCPDSPLLHNAREELAILDELAENLGGALDQYFALEFQPDIAYLLDAKMSIPQIEAYYQATPDNAPVLSYELPSAEENNAKPKTLHYSRRDLLAYTLGIRYLREEKWDQAEMWLKRAPALATAFNKQQDDFGFNESSAVSVLTAAHELRDAQQAVAKAGTDTARAEALYRYASYYYSHGTLLLYNGALWHGDRAFNFTIYWSEHQPTPADASVARRYHYAHEVYRHAYDLCLQVAQRYPNTPAAPKALYRAACASRRLASFNGWWREDNKQENHWTEATRLMQELARRYPNDPLAHNARKYADVFAQEGKDIQW
jgi:hypothetical protein